MSFNFNEETSYIFRVSAALSENSSAAPEDC